MSLNAPEDQLHQTTRLSAVELAAALGTPPPTPEQVVIIEAPLEPTVVVAGAGSGKTETMAARVVWLIANGHVAPSEVLGLTFTRKAALELADRLADKLQLLTQQGLWRPQAQGDDGLELPTVSTYHAYAGRLVSEHGLRIGVEPDVTLLSEAASWQLAHEVVHSWEGPMEGMDLAASTVVRAVVSLAAELGEHLVTPEQAVTWLTRVAERLSALPGQDGKKPLKVGAELAAILRRHALVYPLVEAYRAAKDARGVLDFGDQMAIAAQLARDIPAVGASERVRYQAVLLDEFQDTSEAQMVLVSSLFAAREERTPRPITAVGDPYQSIYGWRGASATTLSRFPREFTTDGEPAQVLHLSTSWRNDEQVLAVANEVARPLAMATPIEVRTLGARPGAEPGQVQIARLPDTLAEAEQVAEWISAHWGSGPMARTAAVLCRARAQFPAIVEALRRRGLPVEVVGLGGLLDTPEVLDLVALLWVAQEPTRGDQMMRLLTGPVCRLGAADVDALWAWAREQARVGHRSGEQHAGEQPPGGEEPGGGELPARPEVGAVLAEALDPAPPPEWIGRDGQHLSPEGSRRVRWLAEVIARVRSVVGLPLPDLVLETERLLGLDLEIAADPDLHPTWGRAQLDAIAEVAAGYAAAAERVSLGGFLDWLDAAREHERGLEGAEVPELAEIEVDSSAVQVLTVHAAKGLEWDLVAVPGLVEGTFPAGTVTAYAHDGQWRVKPRNDKGWLSGIGKLPTQLRGDKEGRPDLGWASVTDTHELRAERDRVAAAGGQFSVEEERRLAYVAFTRARHRLLLSAPVWSTGKKPRVTSRFLSEAREIVAPSAVLQWAPMPDPDDPVQQTNPRLAEEESMTWPVNRESRREVVQDLAAALVSSRAASPQPVPTEGPWSRIMDLLLAEREEAGRNSAAEDLPAHLSTSSVVDLAADPEDFRLRLRRPVPLPPAPQARLGARFHAWVEQHYAAPALVDVDDLVDVVDPAGPDQDGPSTDPAGDNTASLSAEDGIERSPSAEGEEDLAILQANFLASEWAGRIPLAIEVPVETTIAGRKIRGRLDAVFPDSDGSVTVVDWKTGRVSGPAQLRQMAVQLSVYRVAYARLQQVPLDEVAAAFFFARDGITVRPKLLEEAELEELLATLGAGPDESAQTTHRGAHP